MGSASGVLSKSLEAGIIVMVILTTFLAPPLLRLVFKPQAEENLLPEGAGVAVESPPEG
nr:hypothetical protein [Thermostichus lividus]